MDVINNEWGILATLLGLAMVLLIFGSALRFIFSAGRTNRRFRWVQLVSQRYRRQQPNQTEDARDADKRGY